MQYELNVLWPSIWALPPTTEEDRKSTELACSWWDHHSVFHNNLLKPDPKKKLQLDLITYPPVFRRDPSGWFPQAMYACLFQCSQHLWTFSSPLRTLISIKLGTFYSLTFILFWLCMHSSLCTLASILQAESLMTSTFFFFFTLPLHYCSPVKQYRVFLLCWVSSFGKCLFFFFFQNHVDSDNFSLFLCRNFYALKKILTNYSNCNPFLFYLQWSSQPLTFPPQRFCQL